VYGEAPLNVASRLLATAESRIPPSRREHGRARRQRKRSDGHDHHHRVSP